MSMSDDHKAALAEGRTQSKAVRDYLLAIEENKPKRGRKRTVETMTSQLEGVEAELGNANGVEPMKRLELIQRKLDLTHEIERAGDDGGDLSAAEAEFVAAAGPYSARRGISYGAWRELGVAPAVLKKAGISRGS